MTLEVVTGADTPVSTLGFRPVRLINTAGDLLKLPMECNRGHSFLTVIATPLKIVLAVEILITDRIAKVAVVILPEHENGVTRPFEILEKLSLILRFGEIAYRPQKFIALISPVKNTT